MIRVYKLTWMLLALLLLASGSLFAQAQVSCSSDDGARHHCNADTRGGVRLLRQDSGSRCALGYSWGYDTQGVWVDHGCRGQFAMNAAVVGLNGYGAAENIDRGGDWNTYHNATQQPIAISCSSNGGRQVCPANVLGDVRMVRQRSGSPCQEGYSWGRTQRGIWVDHGCRADFEISAYNNNWRQGWFNEGAQGRVFRCSSDDGDRNTCKVNTRNGVTLLRQISGSPCQQGYSWGYDRRGIWVDHGCRAEFQVR